MLKSKISSESSKTTKLLKQASSPLIQRPQYAGSIYSSLTYLRKPLPNHEHHLNNKKQNNINQGNVPPKRRRIKFVDNQANQKSPTVLLTGFTQMVKKSKIEHSEKKHFKCTDNPQLLKFFQQEPEPQKKLVSLSKYRKIAQDFADGIDPANRPQNFQQQKRNKKVGKKGKYRLNMFKSSNELGILQDKTSTRKPCLTRTQSSIEFG